MARAAQQHADDLAEHNIFGHTGSDGSNFSQRILGYCKKGQGAMSEIIGPDFLIEGRNNAEMTVLGLIIDDGVADRGHRKTIFNPNYKYIGCGSKEQEDKLVTVFNLTERNLHLRSLGSSRVSSRSGSDVLNGTAPHFKTNTASESSVKEEPLSCTEPKAFKKKERRADGERRGSVFGELSNQLGGQRMSTQGKKIR